MLRAEAPLLFLCGVLFCCCYEHLVEDSTRVMNQIKMV